MNKIPLGRVTWIVIASLALALAGIVVPIMPSCESSPEPDAKPTIAKPIDTTQVQAKPVAMEIPPAPTMPDRPPKADMPDDSVPLIVKPMPPQVPTPAQDFQSPPMPMEPMKAQSSMPPDNAPQQIPPPVQYWLKICDKDEGPLPRMLEVEGPGPQRYSADADGWVSVPVSCGYIKIIDPLTQKVVHRRLLHPEQSQPIMIKIALPTT